MLDLTTTDAVPPAITAAASFVASATARHDAANATLAEAEAAAARVRERITALEAERQVIATCRARGDHGGGDGSRLELIRLDLEGLAAIAAEADTEVTDRRHRAEAEQRIVANARSQFARAEDESSLAAIVDHAHRLDALMADTLQQATVITQRIGGAISYVPSPALATSFRRLLAAAGRL